MNEDKAARYHRLRRRSAGLAAAWTLGLLLALLLTGGSRTLRDVALAAAADAGLPVPFQLAAGAAICALAIGILHEAGAFPFAWFGAFLLDRRYGLSRQTFTAWGIDYLKGLGLGLVAAAAAAACVYLALAWWPGWWWLPTAAGAVVVSIGLTWAAPIIVFPLFFRVTPLQKAGLRDRLMALAEGAGARAVGIYEWRLGEKTSRANAVLTGMGNTRRILVSDTLVSDYSDEEIAIILAHELSHHVHHDVWRGLALEAAIVTLGLWAGDAGLRLATAPLGLGAGSDLAGMPVLVLAAMGVSLLALPLSNAISRGHERRADRYALDTTRNPAAFISAMRRLAARNLAEDDPPRLARIFFHTHPPFADRLASAQAWVPPDAGRP